MVFTEEYKAFVKILFLIIGYGQRKFVSSVAKDEKGLDWKTLSQSCAQSGCPDASMAVVYA